MLTYEEAFERLLASARPIEASDAVALTGALGRILAKPQVSAVQVPPQANSAMDGYAVRCADVTTAGIALPVMPVSSWLLI